GGCAGLARGGAGQALLVPGDAAGIDQQERPLRVEPADPVIAVPGHPGLIVHQRVTAAGEHVEQRRFPDVGATDQGDEWEHGRPPAAAYCCSRYALRSPSTVCTTSTPSATTGEPLIGSRPARTR